MFDRLASSKSIAPPTFFACIEQKMFLNFFKNITPHILLTFVFQGMFHRLAALPPLLVKQFSYYCQTSTTCNNFLATRQSCLRISSHLDSNVFGRCQTAKQFLLSKFKMFDQQCLILWPWPKIFKSNTCSQKK